MPSREGKSLGNTREGMERSGARPPTLMSEGQLGLAGLARAGRCLAGWRSQGGVGGGGGRGGGAGKVMVVEVMERRG